MKRQRTGLGVFGLMVGGLLGLSALGAGGATADPLPTLPLTDYTIEATYEAPGGTRIQTETPALLLVPIPVNVDDDLTTGTGGAEVLAQLVIDAGRATFRVQTLPGAPAAMKLRIEAIIPDPRGNSDIRVAFGYDALHSKAPGTFSSTVHLIGAARVTSISLDIETLDAGPTIAILAEVYEEGPAGERLDPQRGRVSFTPVPTVAHIGILQGSDFGIQQSGVDVTTDTPTRIDLVIEDVRGDDLSRGTVTIDHVPHIVSLVLTDHEDGRRTWSYQATERIGWIELNIRDTEGGEIQDDFWLRLRDMSMSVLLVQDTPTHATMTSESPIGTVEVGTANGRAVAFLDEPTYFYSTDDGDTDSFAFRINGLSRAEFDSGDPFIVDVDIAPGPLHVLIEDGSRVIDGWVRDLPSSIRFEYSAATGTVRWRGSAPLGEIDIRATDPAGLAGRATRLHLNLTDVPRELEVAYGEAAGEARLEAVNGAIGRATLLLTSGPDLVVDDGFDGVVFHDVPERYALAIRLNGLELVSVSTGEPPYDFRLRKAPGPFLVHILQDSSDLRLEMHDLPSEITATFDPAGSLRYTGSAPIGLVTAVMTDPAGITGRVTRVDLRVEDLPQSLELAYGEDGQALIDAGDQRIGLLTLLMTSGPALVVEPGFDGLELEDVEGHYAVAARITGLRRVSVDTGQAPYAFEIAKDAGPFLVRLDDGTRRFRLEVHDLPATIAGTFDPEGSMTYTASDDIGLVTALVTDPSGVAGRATRLSLRVEDLPKTLTLSYASEGTAVVDAHGARIGSIAVNATSGPIIEVDPGFDGLVLQDVPSHYAFAARLTGLRKVSVSTGDAPYEALLQKDAGPFLVHLVQGDSDARIEVHDLPDSLDATLDPAGSLSYVGSAPIDLITAEVRDPAGIGGRATRLSLRIDGVPASLTLGFGSGSEAVVDAGGGTIGAIDVLLTSGPVVGPAAGFDGFVLEDVASHFAFGARLTGLRVARVTTGAAPYTLTLKKAAGPFMIKMTQGSRLVDVMVLNLPSDLTATFDPSGALTYTASAAIDTITAEIVDPAGVSGRATRATALLRSVPANLNVSWNGAGGSMVADAKGATVGLLEVMLTSGPVETLPADRDGVILKDIADRYVMFARLTGLKKVTFAQGPPPSFTLNTTGGRLFVIDIATRKPAGTATVNGTITVLPSSVSVTFTNATTLSYVASAPVASVTIDAFDPDGISGRAKTLHALLSSVPTALEVKWDTSGTVTFDAKGGTVGLVELQLTSGPNDRIDPAFDGLLLNDLTDRYVLFGRITGLRKIVGTQQPQPDITLETTGGRIFKVELNEQDGSKLEYTRATLDRLVPSVRLRTTDNGTVQEIFYNASGPTNSLTMESNSGDRWKLSAFLGNPLPATVRFCAAENGYCTGFRNGNPRAGSFLFDASEHTDVDVFDCARPLSSACVRGSASEFTDLRDWRVRHVEFDADFDDLGFSGHTYIHTQNHAMRGYLLAVSGSGGFEANFPWGFSANNRKVEWDFWGLFKDKNGSINCPGGTSLSVRVLGFWLGVTSYMC